MTWHPDTPRSSDPSTEKFQTKFWGSILCDVGSHCWAWQGLVNDSGYGYIFYRGRKEQAHRVAYELLVGEIPKGMVLDHKCHDPLTCPGGVTCPHRRCVNTDHLAPTTIRENVLRGATVPAANAAKTHCSHGHEFTPENTISHKRGRDCRICARRRAKETAARKRARRNSAITSSG